MRVRQFRISTAHLAWLTALALSLVLSTWAASSGDLWAYFSSAVPEGQLLYVLSKACALTAVVLVWIQMLAGLTIASRGMVSPRISIQWHQQLGVAVLAMLLFHWATFVAGVSLRIDRLAVDYIFPTLSHGFYRAVVSLGMASFAIMLVASLAPLVRTRFQRWRTLHICAAIGAIGGAVHSWLIGSETRMGPVRWLYIFMIVVLACTCMWRVLSGWRRWEQSREAMAQP